MPAYNFFLDDGHRIASDLSEDLADDGAARHLAETMAWELAKNRRGVGGSYVLAQADGGRDVHKAYLGDFQGSHLRPK
jgi:hypothetical protein